MRAPASSLDLTTFRRALLRWFDAEKRDLPWRRTCDPYAIWVAEIMLQQTRVAAVLEHYREFLRRFPTIQALAKARTPSVLAAWSGLGYYRRARALHQAAKVVVREHGGALPGDETALARLPGIGRYTAAAIASTAFGRTCAVVDGNVERVLTRILGVYASQRELWDIATHLLSRRRPGDFNQAMMELGATVCVPGNPRCDACPLRRWCTTRGHLRVRTVEVRHKREISYLVSVKDGRVLLVQRDPKASLMPSMWELPQASVARASHTQPIMRLRHAITNTDWLVTVVAGEPASANGRWISISRLQQLPLTGLARKILRRAGHHLKWKALGRHDGNTETGKPGPGLFAFHHRRQTVFAR